MKRIVVTDAMDINTFRKALGPGFSLAYEPGISPEGLREKLAVCDVLVVKPRMRVDAGMLAGSPVKLIGVLGSGSDQIDAEATKAAGIEVATLPDEGTESVAEYTMTMLGNLSRGIVQASQSLAQGKWEKDRFLGGMLKGKTLGVLGMGRIGKGVAERARAFGMEVAGYDPYVPEVSGVRMVRDLGSFLEQADLISVHVPLMKETEGLVGAREIGRMKEGVLIVNASRARIFERKALLEGLKSRIGGYATDVHYHEPPGEEDRELLSLGNVIATPHIGAQTREAQASLAEKMAALILGKQ